MSVPSGIIVGYLRGLSDGVLGRVVKSRGWRMAHGEGVSACAVGGVEMNVGIVLARVDMSFHSAVLMFLVA